MAILNTIVMMIWFGIFGALFTHPNVPMENGYNVSALFAFIIALHYSVSVIKSLLSNK